MFYKYFISPLCVQKCRYTLSCSSYGLEAIKKLGIERRLVTAGENKAIMDPFLPINPKHKKHIDELLNDVHQQFIDVVRLGRGDRLADNKDIFSGLFGLGRRQFSLDLQTN